MLVTSQDATHLVSGSILKISSGYWMNEYRTLRTVATFVKQQTQTIRNNVRFKWIQAYTC